MGLREVARQMLDAALAAVDAGQAVRRVLQPDRPVWVAGAGKAAAVMAAAAEDALGDTLQGGVVVTQDGHQVPTRKIQVLQAAHPVPDERSLVAARAIRGVLQQADNVVFLLSGGASALLEELPDGLSLSDLRIVTDTLLRAGEPIEALNTVRKHLSRVKGGQLALALRGPCRVLVLSDVLGSPLDVIGSGPLALDRSTRADAVDVLRRCGLSRFEPYLTETPKEAASDRVHSEIIGDNRAMVEAAAAASPFPVLTLTTFLEGEAREAGRLLAAIAREIRTRGRPLQAPCCILASGEPTVHVTGNGRGGRCSEMAAGFALGARGLPGVLLLAAASDGTDGPTDAAGAFADGNTASRGPLADALARNDTATFFQRLGDALVTGPTGTNVNDIAIMLMEG